MSRFRACILLLILAGCHSRQRPGVTFHFIGGFNRHFEIKKVDINADGPITIDSGIGRAPRDSFFYALPPGEPAAYRIQFEGKPFSLTFVYDSTDMDVFYNYTNGQYHFAHSPASEEWKQFQAGQQAIVQKQRQLGGRPGDAISPQLDSLINESFRRNRRFADTVTNPALFLLAYAAIDFGPDYKGLEQYMQQVKDRFPHHTGVQTLVRRTLDYARIFSSPLRIGDSLPGVTLPDADGNEVTIAPAPGKLTLVDFWSTWCDRCRLFADAKKQAWKQLGPSQLAIISVAIDAEKANWQSLIRHEQYPWPQLIDEQMWTGLAAHTLRFDSIPFNFLVGPDGRILAKGIPADSLLTTLATFIKR